MFTQLRGKPKRTYAHIIHSKTNAESASDGLKDEGVTFPSWTVQRNLLQESYEKCGVDPLMIDFVEAHGTGSKAGDPQRINAIVEVSYKRRTESL